MQSEYHSLRRTLALPPPSCPRWAGFLEAKLDGSVHSCCALGFFPFKEPCLQLFSFVMPLPLDDSGFLDEFCRTYVLSYLKIFDLFFCLLEFFCSPKTKIASNSLFLFCSKRLLCSVSVCSAVGDHDVLCTPAGMCACSCWSFSQAACSLSVVAAKMDKVPWVWWVFLDHWCMWPVQGGPGC